MNQLNLPLKHHYTAPTFQSLEWSQRQIYGQHDPNPYRNKKFRHYLVSVFGNCYGKQFSRIIFGVFKNKNPDC